MVDILSRPQFVKFLFRDSKLQYQTDVQSRGNPSIFVTVALSF